MEPPAGWASFLSLIGLVVIGVISFSLLGGKLPGLPGGAGPARSATPSNVVLIDPRTKIPGSLTYVKSGNVWLQRGDKAGQLTASGHDSMPTFSPDGKWIYFVRSEDSGGSIVVNGVRRPYALSIPALMRISPDGGVAEQLLSGKVEKGKDLWSFFIREPSISPDGATAALISDGPTGAGKDLVLQFLNLDTLKLTDPGLPEETPLGHQDPAWSPLGDAVLYVRNSRDGTRGVPAIVKYDLATEKTATLSGAGYLSPAWSPDGRYVAATNTSAFGTDIVILDAKTGAEVLRLTNDENSFAPVWSPAGDSIGYFQIDRGVVDLFVVQLVGSGPNWTVLKPLGITLSAGLDAGSRPSWFIPADEMPTPPPSAAPSEPGGSGAESSASPS
jgi:Tol biopolymer transport system component